MADPGSRGWRLVRATSTAIPASVRRFNARARARRFRSARPWFLAAALVALGGLVSFAFYGTSLLGVARIAVTFPGGDPGYVSAADVRAAAGVPPGSPLASVDLRATAVRVERLVAVSGASVSRHWPRTLAIEVRPRQAVAAVPFGDAALLIDRSGVVFHRVARIPDGLVELRLPAPGPRDPTTRAALSVLGSLPSDLRGRVDSVDATAPTRITLRLSDGHTVIWGDDAENGTKARVVLSLLAEPGKVIDVSAPPLVTVR